MDRISDEGYNSLLGAMQTRSVSTIVHTLLDVEQIVAYMREAVNPPHIAAPLQLHHPQCFQMDTGNIRKQTNIEAIDLSMKCSSSQRQKLSHGRQNLKLKTKARIFQRRQPLFTEISEDEDYSDSGRSPSDLPASLVVVDESTGGSQCTSLSSPQPSTTGYLGYSMPYENSFESEASVSNQEMETTAGNEELGIRSPNSHHLGHKFPSKRPTKCTLCSKFVRADNFQVHMRSHTGEKPYKCPICPFRSANPSSMPKHLRLHDRGREMLKSAEWHCNSGQRNIHIPDDENCKDYPVLSAAATFPADDLRAPITSEQISSAVSHQESDTEGDMLLFNRLKESMKVVDITRNNINGLDLTILHRKNPNCPAVFYCID